MLEGSGTRGLGVPAKVLWAVGATAQDRQTTEPDANSVALQGLRRQHSISWENCKLDGLVARSGTLSRSIHRYKSRLKKRELL